MLTLAIVLAVLPLLANIALMVRHKQYMRLKRTRYRTAMVGLGLALITSIPVPLFYVLLELPSGAKGDWLLPAANNAMAFAIVFGLIAIGCLAFARGKVRWIGILTTVVSLAMLYVTMLGLSY
jgi:hypothetical protein